MKNILLVLITLLSINVAFSQTYQDDVDLIQSIYGQEKKEIVDAFVELSESQAPVFWELYNEYETKRRSIGQKRYAILWNYVNDYGTIRAADAEMMMDEALPLRVESDKLVRNYYKKIKSKTDAVVATQFYQIENYLGDLVRIKILEELYISKIED